MASEPTAVLGDVGIGTKIALKSDASAAVSIASRRGPEEVMHTVACKRLIQKSDMRKISRLPG